MFFAGKLQDTVFEQKVCMFTECVRGWYVSAIMLDRAEGREMELFHWQIQCGCTVFPSFACHIDQKVSHQKSF